jgi:putative ABC transport system permease protein
MEFRLALRALLARPTLSAAVVLALALGIAITTALFSVVDALLLRPLPFSEAHQIVALDERPHLERRGDVGWREVADERRQVLERLESSPLVQLVSQAGHATFFDPGPAAAAGIAAHGVDARFFALFRVQPVLGTSFSREHEEAAAAFQRGSSTPLPVLISYEFWQQRYGGDPRIVGGVQSLLQYHVRILGVMPSGFRFPGETNVWAPVDSTRGRPPAYARLQPGASVPQLAGAFPELAVLPLREAVRPGGQGAILLLFGAATLLLLAAWIQVAGLTFSGAVGRLPEFGSRLALGATRGRLFRQTLVENGLLAGAALALAFLALPPTC